MNAVLVYVTAPNREEAVRIGRTLVSESLVACANVLDGLTSIFRWHGEIQQESETLLLLKTRDELALQVVQARPGAPSLRRSRHRRSPDRCRLHALHELDRRRDC